MAPPKDFTPKELETVQTLSSDLRREIGEYDEAAFGGRPPHVILKRIEAIERRSRRAATAYRRYIRRNS